MRRQIGPPRHFPRAATLERRQHDANFEQWIFPGVRNGPSGRERIESRLKFELAALDRTCHLTEAEQQKLLLAARGDISRFFEQVKEVRQNFRAIENDPNAIQEVWPEIQALQTRQAGGCLAKRRYSPSVSRGPPRSRAIAKLSRIRRGATAVPRHRAAIEAAGSLVWPTRSP